MTRLDLASKPIQGIKENSSKHVDKKSGENTMKIMKKKNDSYNLETKFMHKDQLH
jgi:hypothetical protein